MIEFVDYPTERCLVCGKTGTVTMLMAQAEAISRPDRPNMQILLPTHTADEREQVISGTHPECWEKL